jgi:hypothetical protein
MGMTMRKAERIVEPEPVREGAGVMVRRSIGTRQLDYVDPFLLLDHFASRDRADYEAGFPMHPHRGIETVTYLLAGEVRHRDTTGSSGAIGAGAVQWMTAGRGILHEEMPQMRPEGIAGFQLWVNLPARLKMTPPRYQEFKASQIPEVVREGARIRVIAGAVDGTSGPVRGIAADPLYLDVSLPARASFTQAVARGHAAFTYVFEGEAVVEDGLAGKGPLRVPSPQLIVWGDGDAVRVGAGERPARFLLVSGKPLGEPVARHGPFVMNTREEIERTLRELRQGTFVS